MNLKIGARVKHKINPDWGIGIIVEEDNDSYFVKYEHKGFWWTFFVNIQPADIQLELEF